MIGRLLVTIRYGTVHFITVGYCTIGGVVFTVDVVGKHLVVHLLKKLNIATLFEGTVDPDYCIITYCID